MRWLTLFIFTVILLLPAQVRAATLAHQHVSQNELWQSGVYHLNSLEIDKGVELIIQAPSTLAIDAGGEVLIEGKLTVTGGKLTITNAQPGYSWLGVRVKGESNTLSNLIIERSLQGVVIESARAEVANILLRDNVSNRISTNENVENIRFEHIEIGNRNADGPSDFEGIIINSRPEHEPEVRVNHLLFSGFEIIDQNNGGVAIRGPYALAEILDMTSLHDCRNYGFIVDRSKEALFSFQKESCRKKPPSPIIFLPGVGTSVNTALLSSVNALRDESGWFFIPTFVPGHAELITMVRAKVPVKVCFYDWRQKPNDSPVETLKKCIDDLKSLYSSSDVQIIAHSYGGIVARNYIQSTGYQNDVSALYTMGTPSEGSAKAMPIWNQGILPRDWQILTPIIRFYQFITGEVDSLSMLRRAFPSMQVLLPTYVPYRPEQNQILSELDKEKGILFGRTLLTEIVSGSEPTLREFETGSTDSGDGSVLLTSAGSLTKSPVIVTGSHAALAAASLSYFANIFHTVLKPPLPNESLQRGPIDLKWFYFDCPVSATVKSPSGVTVSTTIGQPVFTDQEATIVSSGELSGLRFVALPNEVGLYTVSVEALADTNVRAWVDDGKSTTWEQSKGVVVSYQYQQPKEPAPVEEKTSVTLPPALIAEASFSPSPLASAFSPNKTKLGSIFDSPVASPSPVLALQLVSEPAPKNTENDRPLAVSIALILLFATGFRKWYRVRVRSQ